MSHEERTNLLHEIEEIRTQIERLQPEVYQQEATGTESRRPLLVALRKELARDKEQQHTNRPNNRPLRRLGYTMTSGELRAQTSCRLFVLAMLGTIVLAFLLVLGLFHRPLVVVHRLTPSTARAQRH